MGKPEKIPEQFFLISLLTKVFETNIFQGSLSFNQIKMSIKKKRKKMKYKNYVQPEETDD